MSKAEIIDFLKSNSKDNTINFSAEQEASLRFGMSMRDIEFIALNEGIMPVRYIRNTNTFSINDQLKFHQSHVTVIGCGGLGGNAIEQLIRIGIGTVRVVDYDIFEEHNLNRQILSNIELIGQPKVIAAKERAYKINPAVIIEALQLSFDYDTASTILEGTQVVIDALDNIKSRLLLAEQCRKLHIPLVHGSLGGYYGQVTTQFPEDDSLQRLFAGSPDRGIERTLGTPAFTPTFISSIQVVESINIILNKPSNLNKTLLFVDLNDFSFKRLNF